MTPWDCLKAFLFKIDAESMHEWSTCGIRFLGDTSPHLLEFISKSPERISVPSRQEKIRIPFAGKILSSPVGLAAGFDKNARLVPYLPHLGFSHAEIGSVTLRAQAGNPKPRLFRGEDILFNRMGFNNDGAEAIAKRLDTYTLPKDFALGINLGLNKETPNEKAAEEYLESFRVLSDYGDYFVVNVSSPNTPGLRELQQLSEIEKIFSALRGYSRRKPLYLKLAPELEFEVREQFYTKAVELGIDGFVLTNTLKGTRGDLVGGFSGAALTTISGDVLTHAKRHTQVPLISVGGIMSAETAVVRKKLGAHLVQVYTGWVFRGPTFPEAIRRAWLAA